MFKKTGFIVILSIFSLKLFAESKIVKYVKGNISDKTAAVREASGTEADFLCEKALDFVLLNKDLLGNDRELDALAVAAALSISNDYISSLSEKQKLVLMNKLSDLFAKFTNSGTVQSTIISKVVAQHNQLPYSDFTAMLNSYIYKTPINQIDSSVAKSIFSSLEVIGNSESFTILYSLWNNPKYSNYSKSIESALASLVPLSMNEIIKVVQTGKIDQISLLFKLIKNNTNIPKNYCCEIAENVLSESILLMDDSSKITDLLTGIQIESMKILSENNWTRASTVALAYFEFSKTLYSLNYLKEAEMKAIISSLCNISPLNAVTPLTMYLEELNSKKEQNETVSNEIVLSVINTLGAIGDKSAFDSLLAVTYLTYPESILSAARGALAGLRW